MDLQVEQIPFPAGDKTKQTRHIPVAAPVFAGKEREYVNDCMESGWISAGGKYVELFENAFANYCGVQHAIACCNGTAALHLALLALGVEPGDEVIVPTLTFVATANAVKYCGARPVFIDSDVATWNIDPELVESKITPRTRGIIAVHLYGLPAGMRALRDIADRHGLFLLEDAAEAHGATYERRHTGALGDIAAFSFYGNKILATGEGGMVVTNRADLAEKVRLLHGQGVDPNRRYWFPIIGYNYRMMNLPAAIGLAQLEQADWHSLRRREVAASYKEILAKRSGIIWQTESEHSTHAYWMFTILLDEQLASYRDHIMKRLAEHGIETRPIFYPIHQLPPYIDAGQFPVAEMIAARGISLPTWAGLSADDIEYVCECLSTVMASLRKQ